ncbi:MAG TPA: hypothetical protein VMK12_12720, partial [Anaeromyxobacteraceae bacterium]|nr:hypothetical protein [Anaeromyxobacteraceae bacterium]
MRRVRWLFGFVILTSLFTGRGGADTGSVFAGSWTGTWADKKHGTITITIDRNGHIAGMITDST